MDDVMKHGAMLEEACDRSIMSFAQRPGRADGWPTRTNCAQICAPSGSKMEWFGTNRAAG